MNPLLLFAIAGALTIGIRWTATLLGPRLAASSSIADTLGLVGPAFMGAMLAGALFLDAGALAGPSLPTAGALSLTLFLSSRGTGQGLSMLAGLAAYLLLV